MVSPVPGIYIPAEGSEFVGRRSRDSRKWRTIQPNAQHSIEVDEIESLMNS
jgi:hypothetical protein